jgi:FlaA1/EpsC-like NDP-sugar epimerase/EAL domain-containing protein (putative c-di-GMP-specific phosphodiesterase class I)
MKTIIRSIVKLIKNKCFIADLAIFLLTTMLAFVLRLDGDAKEIIQHFHTICFLTIVFTLIKLATINFLGLYRRVWRYTSLRDLVDISLAIVISSIIEILVFEILRNSPNISWLEINNLPRSLPILDSLLSLVVVIGYRYIPLEYLRIAKIKRVSPNAFSRILVIGAGNAGISIVQQMQQNVNLGMKAIAFIDDNPRKLHQNILGLNVVGDRNFIAIACKTMHINQVIIAMPSALGEDIRAIAGICKQNNIAVSTLPSLSEILRKDLGIQLNTVRDIQIEDLLRRPPIKTDLQKVSELVNGKRIIVTGAGGSIGGEICRQILKFHPAEIVLLGKGENSIFLIHQELEKTVQFMNSLASGTKPPKLHTFICDIRSPQRLDYLFSQFKPEIIFHAAAHKHVPLMEMNPAEAVTTNIFGTKNLVDLALHYQVKNFVMISTDKAVNPTNVMGATKRVAEMTVLQAAKLSNRSFTVVRFGNVLGSRGSVVPTFKRQISEGGPITITHPDIIRYFMTIPEAVQLVLQTSVISHGGEVCMLDMGEPVKILDLATDLIQLSGYEVGKDIKIVYTGLRPGEKLFEELFIPGERYERTQHEKVRIVRNASDQLPPLLNVIIEKLGKAAEQNDSQAICELLQTIVFGYTSSRLMVKSNNRLSNNIISVSISAIERLYNSGSDSNEDISVGKPNFLAEELQKAFDNQEFRLYYQSIVNLATKETIGFEALLRWQSPERGMISPTEFIADLEKTGLIIPIGWWEIREVLQQLSLWQQQFPDKTIDISINLSEQQLFHGDLIPQITAISQEHKINPNSFGLEIPANVLHNHEPETLKKVLLSLKALGVMLQLDGVKIEHSFLTDLDRLNELYSQFDRFKVYQESIKDVNSEVLQNIARKTNDLGIDIIALCVDNFEQSIKLRSLHCKYGQGYLFASSI